MAAEARARRLRVLAVIPVYGHTGMTHDLVADLDRERALCDVVVVDNKGDYRAAGTEEVLRPGRNLGWAGGTNFGSRRAGVGYGHLLWLNNDTRLTRHFVRSLIEAAVVTRAGVTAPFYDCHWVHQRGPSAPVDTYRPSRKHYRAPFVDGTCMLVARRTVDRIGLLDDATFAPLGWGAEIDYCLRAREAGLGVVATRQAFLHHLRAVTALEVFAGRFERYTEEAYPRSLDGMARKWGADWMGQAGIDPETFQTGPLPESERIYALPVPGWPAARRVLRRLGPLGGNRSRTRG